MKINEARFSELCAEVISDIMNEEALSKGESKVLVMLIGTIVVGKIKTKIFSEDEEIEIVKEI